MPSRNHARVSHNLSVLLDRFRDRYTVFQQLSLNLDGWQTIPDISLYKTDTLPSDWLSDEDEVAIPPALVIEILSPKQNLQPLIDKIRVYAQHGVKSCWLVQPATGLVSVFPSSGGSRGFVEGSVLDDTAEIEIPLSGIFL